MTGCSGEAAEALDRPGDVRLHSGRIARMTPCPRPSTRWSYTRTAFTSISPAAMVPFPGRWQPLRPAAVSAGGVSISPSATEAPVSPSGAAALICRALLSDDLADPGAVRRGDVGRLRLTPGW
ncbi:hypothetical protein GCM10011579_035250 [Streptomyces albiflavescens]|uniref:Uncharacterized protein n=1 Tax=Streptomyces albiflavescens TaxID=1623582 RepID=A0A917Y3U9_9ACTN|nr:hypothetical protein [Streptomyces albiflavescens]GGN65104.1 hypothetical protein GCM10011579_035250 [Streptomyces albiflavescens]